MKLITVNHLAAALRQYGAETFIQQLLLNMEHDFLHWSEFDKSSRHATHFPNGVIELMPCANDRLYSFKYVNGHPKNTEQGKLCVAALGVLADVDTGYPLLLSEMTLLTAIRTATVAALAAKLMARADSTHLGIVGTGAQSEFQLLAIKQCFDVEQVYYFDIDAAAMDKFATNAKALGVQLVACSSIDQVVSKSDILVTATADKNNNQLVSADMLHPGMHIHAMGGDCPGKTEFSSDVLEKVKLVVEYLPQSLVEGEVQQGGEADVLAELWQLLTGEVVVREAESDITFFDSVGFALEDFSALRTLWEFSNRYDIGESVDLIPSLANPKDLFSLIAN